LPVRAAAFAVISIFAITFSAGPAAAHLPVVQPDKFEVTPGGLVEFRAGLAEPLIKFAYSKELLGSLGHDGGVSSLTGDIKYADGTSSPIRFFPSNTAKPETSSHNWGSAVVEKAGTSVVTLKFDFNSGTRPTVAFGKTLLNWTADSAAAKSFGEDVLEITVAGENTGPVSWGDGITVQVALRGRPLPNVTASATYDGAPLPKDPEEGEENNNEYIRKNTDESGKVTFKPDRPGTWIIAVEYSDESAPKNRDEYSDAKRYPEWKGIRYRGTLVFQVPK
jgi:hypothetical protein